MSAQLLATQLHLHPLVAEVLWQRGYRTVEAARAFLNPDAYAPASPFELPDLDKAVARLQQAIAQHERIRVWGDFDVDGQSSTSVLFLGLRALGAEVDYTIPNRATHSHGLNKPGLQRAKDEGVCVILTCDCGVTDFDEIAFAQKIGLDVIVSDHHDLVHIAPSPQGEGVGGEVKLPAALAIINPKRLPESHPLINLPGVGVAYKLIEGLSNPQSPIPNLLLDLVALGIVADVAYQQADTRYLLQRGLQQLRSNPRPGIRALLRAAGANISTTDADTIGFQLGPRLNAAGRLDTAELSVQLLTAEDETSANAIAKHIENLNNERRQLQRAVEQDALRMIDRDPTLAKYPVIILQSADWHASVVGVVANTISERYGRPAMLISVRPGEVGRGSARSLPGIDIHAAIAAQTHLIETSGGHPMAAGFGIRSENVQAFRDGVNKQVSEQLLGIGDLVPNPQSLIPNHFSVAWRDATVGLAEQIELLAPFGSGNPRPLLRSDALKFVRAEPLGQDGKHQAIYLQDETGFIARAAWWRSVGQALPEGGAPVSLVFNLRRNVYQGKARAQLEVVSLAFERDDSVASQATVTAHYQMLDHRGELNRAALLNNLTQEFGADNVQVWCEPPTESVHSTQSTQTRLQLTAKPVLVLWSAPASMQVLQQVMALAQPQTVVLVGAIASESDTPEAFMRQLLGMVKVSQQRGESLEDAQVIARMAARVGHREETVIEGIACYRRGESTSTYLTLLLQETRAYCKYFCEASAEAVLRIERVGLTS